jgi:hypothetical protein
MSRLLFRLLFLLPMFSLLGGCFLTPNGGSIAGGECKIFDAPKYVVRGLRQYDQDWIDSTIEVGVGACRWQRPAQRPAAIDQVAGRPVAAPMHPKKRGLIRRIRDRLTRHDREASPPAPTVEQISPEPDHPVPAPKAEQPAPVPEPQPVESAPQPDPVPPPKPRSRLEELLHPSSGR